MSDELKVLTTVENEFEADMVVGLLSDAGIRSMQQLGNSGIGGRVGGGGMREIYVAESDLDRAREVLSPPAEE